MSKSVVESVRMLDGQTFGRSVRKYALEGLSKAEATRASALCRGIHARVKVERTGRGYVVHVTEYGDWEKVKRRKDGAK